MKTLLSLLLLGTALLQAPDQTTYQTSSEASNIQWTGHAQAGAYSPVGSLKIKSGNIKIIKGQLTQATIVVDMNSLTTKSDDMKEHLKGKDFFDVAKYPEAQFRFSKSTGKNASGTLTIKGVSLPATFPINYQVRGDSVFVKADLVIDRTKYGIKYNSASYFQDLGSYAIKNEFELSVNLVAIKQ